MDLLYPPGKKLVNCILKAENKQVTDENTNQRNQSKNDRYKRTNQITEVITVELMGKCTNTKCDYKLTQQFKFEFFYKT